MAGDTGGNGIYYWSNNGIDSTKTMLEETTAPGFGHGSYLVSFVRPSGKSFIKWNTAADGTGTDYFPGDNVEQLLGSGTDLYAIWGDIPLIVQKSSIEDIADAVRARQTGTPTDLGLSSLTTAIGAITSPATIGIKTQVIGHRRLYGTSISTNTLTLATGVLNTRTYIGLFNWCVETNDRDNYETLFVIENGTISYPFGANGSSYGGYILTLSSGTLKIKADTLCCLIGLDNSGRAYSQYNTTDVVFRLYEGQAAA